MTPEQKDAERVEFESVERNYGHRPFAIWLDRAALALQREAELTAEIARLRDELQLKCNPAEIAAQVPDEWRIAVQEFVDRCDRGEIRSRRTYSLFKELLTAAPKRQAVAVPDEWREVLAEVLAQAETWLDEARGGAPADVIGYTGWAERARELLATPTQPATPTREHLLDLVADQEAIIVKLQDELEASPQSANAPTSHSYELELPEGDSRRVQIWYSDLKVKDGVLTHHLCIAVYDEPEPTTEEPSPVDPLAELTAMSQELGVGYGQDEPDTAAKTAPYANCKFRICDLPGQCIGEGGCHHPIILPIEVLRVVRFIFRHFGSPHMAAELPNELVPDIRALEAMFKAQGVIV